MSCRQPRRHPIHEKVVDMSNLKPAHLLLAMALALSLFAAPLVSVAELSISVTLAPPPLPVYDQPPIPAAGYIWTPGYWSYGDDGYFWVPGTWVQAPEVGLLWTPGYWGWSDGVYVWNAGYWGPHIGFYGGVDYGFGYTGRGYDGGYWQADSFYYNRAVNNVSVTNIQTVYTKTVVNNVTVNHVSYNGGEAGVNAVPTPDEQAVAREPHRAATPPQVQHHDTARSNRALLASVNQGKPEIAATPRPAEFAGPGIVKATRTGAPGGAPVVARETASPRWGTTPPRPNAEARAQAGASAQDQGRTREQPPTPQEAMRPGATAQSAVHPSDLPKPAAPITANGARAESDSASDRQRAELETRHDRERQALQQKQSQEHDRLAQQQANQARIGQVERQHQQQTQRLQQRQASEQQRLQQSRQRHAGEPPKEGRPPTR
jgi:hypothetical protein